MSKGLFVTPPGPQTETEKAREAAQQEAIAQHTRAEHRNLAFTLMPQLPKDTEGARYVLAFLGHLVDERERDFERPK